MTTSDIITGMYNEAKIEYDNTAIYKDDSGTRLITALGNYKVCRLGFNPTSRNWNIKTKLENVA